MRLKRDTIKNAELLADETNSVIIGKKFISVKRAGKRAVIAGDVLVASDGHFRPLRERK